MMALSPRDKFIVKVALTHAANNLSGLNGFFISSCAYCGGQCPKIHQQQEDHGDYCDGYGGDIDGLYADPDYGVLELDGEVQETIKPEEIEELMELFK